jgi:hypothetical protein
MSQCKICEDFLAQFADESLEFGPIKVIVDIGLPPDKAIFINFHKIHEDNEKAGRPPWNFIRPTEKLTNIRMIYNLEP